MTTLLTFLLLWSFLGFWMFLYADSEIGATKSKYKNAIAWFIFGPFMWLTAGAVFLGLALCKLCDWLREE